MKGKCVYIGLFVFVLALSIGLAVGNSYAAMATDEISSDVPQQEELGDTQSEVGGHLGVGGGAEAGVGVGVGAGAIEGSVPVGAAGIPDVPVGGEADMPVVSAGEHGLGNRTFDTLDDPNAPGSASSQQQQQQLQKAQQQQQQADQRVAASKGGPSREVFSIAGGTLPFRVEEIVDVEPNSPD